jgi:hypothetical protein
MLRSTDIPLLYVDCDIPDGVTLVEWRREKVAAERRTRDEAREARARARAAAFRRRLPRLRPAPAPSFRPRFA